MAKTSHCPNCAQAVTIPDGLESESTVRCPTCEAEFPLAEALAGATDQEEPAGDDAMAFLKSLQGGSPGADEAPPELVPVATVSDSPREEGSEVAEDEAEEVDLTEFENAEEPQLDVPQEESGQRALEEPVDEEDRDLPGAMEEEPAEESGLELDETEAAADADSGTDEQSDGVCDEEEPGEGEEAGETPDSPAGEAEPSVEEEETEKESEEDSAETDGETQEAAGTEEGSSESRLDEFGGEAATAEEGSEDGDKPAEEGPAAPAAIDPNPLVRCPEGQTEFRLSELIVASTGESIGPVTASLIVQHELLRTISEEEAKAADEAPALDVWGKVEGAPQLDLGGAAAVPDVDHGGFAIQDEELEEERRQSVAGVPLRPRRKGKEKGWLRSAFGWVFGGVAGIVLAVYIIIWIKGPEQGNVFDLPVPGYPSTYKHLPDWWPIWAKPGSATTDEAEAEEEAEPEGKSTESPKDAKPKPSGPRSKAWDEADDTEFTAKPIYTGDEPAPSSKKPKNRKTPKANKSKKASEKPTAKPA